MRPERAYRRQAIAALNFISVHALARKEGWKGSKPPTMQEVDNAIHDLSYLVGKLKDYRSIRIQLEKEKEEEE